MISIDNYLNETTRFAHVILPGPSPLESPHFDELMWGVGDPLGRQVSAPVFPLPEGWPDEWEILIRLGQMLAGKRNADIDFDRDRRRLVHHALPRQGPRPGDDPAALRPRRSGADDRLVDPRRSVRRPLRRAARRLDPGQDQGRAERHRLRPDDPACSARRCAPRPGKIDLAPEYIARRTCRGCRRGSTHRSTGCVLVSRRHLRSKNSWMHNVTVLVKGKDRCTLLVHPDDAAALGLVDGGLARVSCEAGDARGPGRGHRRDDAGRRLAAPRVGPRQAAAPACRSPASTPGSTTTCSPPATSSTRCRATPRSTASRSRSSPSEPGSARGRR